MTKVNWIQYTEHVVGMGHPAMGDVVNRPLREFLTLIGIDPDEDPFPGLPVTSAPGPTDPFISQIETTGDATHPPFIHLLNPIGSGIILKVWRLRVGGTNAQTVKVRRTAAPLAVGGTIVSDTPLRLDEQSPGTPVGVHEGCTAHGGVIFTRAASQWNFPILAENVTDVVSTGDFPLEIIPGSAIEIALDANSASNLVRSNVIWDEELP